MNKTKEIAKVLVENACLITTTGNYIYEWDEIERKFGPINHKALKNEINKFPQITDEGVWDYEGSLDLNFYLSFCPNAVDDETYVL